MIVGTDDGLVREEALALYNELTGGNDDGFTQETIDGNADNSDGAFQFSLITPRPQKPRGAVGLLAHLEGQTVGFPKVERYTMPLK